jgi:predicted O-linked N-acetylglucosamine transferase (SPINDLY family)
VALLRNPGAGNLRREARAASIRRGWFAGRLKVDEHLARHRLPTSSSTHSGAHTPSDALWAGLPVLTCQGQTFAARVASSLLYAVGLPELVTQSLVDYEALALSLARDPARLGDLRQRLARNRDTHPLFDTDRFRRHIEAAYVRMWESWQRGEAPRPQSNAIVSQFWFVLGT